MAYALNMLFCNLNKKQITYSGNGRRASVIGLLDLIMQHAIVCFACETHKVKCKVSWISKYIIYSYDLDFIVDV